MFRRCALAALALAFVGCATVGPGRGERLDAALARFGHRNVVAIVDAAYPEQASESIRVVATDEDQLALLRDVLSEIAKAGHVRPKVRLDRELDFVDERDAPGITKYREELDHALAGVPVEKLEHEQIIASLAATARDFDVLVLKSTLKLPYTSVFITLDCGYWSDAAEARLRAAMPHDAGFVR